MSLPQPSEDGKPISRRLRYEILRRDDNTCRYCGGRAPDVTLTIDHVVPRTLGGTNDPTNLVAACKDCNAGKTSTSPDAPLVAQATADALRWSAALQVAAGKMSDDFQGEWDYANALDEEWSHWTCGYAKNPIPRPSDWRSSAAAWRNAGLPIDLLVDAAQRALGNSKVQPADTWRYFCGIAWKRITQIQEAAKASLTDPEDVEQDECDGQHDCECEAIAYERGQLDTTERLGLRYSHLQFQSLMAVVDAEGMRWAGYC